MELRGNKRRLFLSIAVLLVCSTVLASASYAWLSLSKSPEIVGIDTSICANGNLEIALLNNLTFIDPSLIRTGIGDSAAVQDPTVSNLTWGNMVDLQHRSYGLNEIALLPSRLNVLRGENNQLMVGSNILSVPNFGTDGRIESLSQNTVSAIYRDQGFHYLSDKQSYGVRGIGLSTTLSAQQAALASARALVESYSAAALNATRSAWTANGGAMMDIFIKRYVSNETTFDNSQVAVVRDTAARMLGAFSYLESALRQALMGYAACQIDDETTFQLAHTAIEDTSLPLLVIVDNINIDLPLNMTQWITEVDKRKGTMKKVIARCDQLTDGEYSWEQISTIMGDLIDPDEVYLGNERINSPNVLAQLATNTQLTLTPNAGAMAVIAYFTGNYSVDIQYSQMLALTVKTTSVVDMPYLEQISEQLVRDSAAGNGTISEAMLTDMYGYAVDMAFRSNTSSDLLLQTAATQRQEGQAETMGAGSFMKFSSERLTLEQMILLMDAIRIGFMDHQNQLLAVAKLSTHAYEETESGVQAPIYLYDYSVIQDGSISVGERLEENNVILQLPEDSPTVLTIVVWLDGDHVDNSLAALTAQSMTGTLNLQFASSTQLKPTDIPVGKE